MSAPGPVDAETAAGIRNTIAAYCLALDDGRTDDVVETFCPDATMSIPGTPVLFGHEAIREAYAAMTTGPSRHVVVNTCVTTEMGSAVSATSDVLVLGKGDKGWSVALVGRYNDTFRQTEAGWLFASRVLEFA